MDKTININLGGVLFTIDEDAYRILRDYLHAIDLKFRNVPGGAETIEDIESRIAEIFQSQKGLAGVITRANVEDMIRTVGKPEDFGQTEAEERFYETKGPRKTLFRNPENTIISGVCGGIGAYLNTDPVWIRILFIVFSLVFGIGFFIYLALWIAVPVANTDSRKREMYGSGHNMAMPGEWENSQGNSVGKAFNEVFRAIGKVLFIFARIILIISGIFLVFTGFLILLTFVMVFVFKYPGAFSTDITGFSIAYMPDFLNYIVTPRIVPWIKVLSAISLLLPLLAMIYGGIRLIFWFRVRDGFVWLAGFIIWVMSITALSIILFNEGIGFAETGRTSTRDYFKMAPDTLYIRSARKLSDLRIDKEISVPGDDRDVFYISEDKKDIYFRTSLSIGEDEDNNASVEIRKRSAGRSTLDGRRKSEKLLYNFNIDGKTLYLDEFFTIPGDKKWSFDYVSVRVMVPEGTIIYMDKTVESLFHSTRYEDDYSGPEKRYWEMTRNGLRHLEQQKSKN